MTYQSKAMGFYSMKHYAQKSKRKIHLSEKGKPLCGASGNQEQYTEVKPNDELYKFYKVTCRKCKELVG